MKSTIKNLGSRIQRPPASDLRPLAFTLVELLVVVTIIVVLLALLTPALDKAIYQAELAMCGANLKSVSSGVTGYASEHRRAYPQRHPERAVPSVQINDPWFDWRTAAMRYMSIDALRDPLSAAVDLAPESSRWNALVFSGYTVYAGGHFSEGTNGPAYQGMRRLGDRWAFFDDVRGRLETFSVIAGDRDHRADMHNSTQASHPDDAGRMSLVRHQNAENPWEAQSMLGVGAAQHRVTFSWWQVHGTGPDARGRIDTNYTFADGSVERYVGVIRQFDDRMADVPEYFNSQQYPTATGRRLQVPPR